MFRPTAPPVLLAQMVYSVQGERCVGVPEMLPLSSRVKPIGSVGSISHVSIAGPSFVASMKADSFAARANSRLGHEIRSGGEAVILMRIEVDAIPPVLLAQTVWLVHCCRSVAIPTTVPLLTSKVKPEGSGGSICQESGVPPL